MERFFTLLLARTAALFKQRSTHIVIAIILFGCLLRGWGLYHGLRFHPDERHMVMVTEKMDPRVTLNPESFAYGSLPYYLTRFAAEAVSIFWSPATHYDGLFIVGRVICIIFGLLAIPLTYLLGTSLYKDRFVGILACTFVTLNVLHVQLSHFFTADIMLTTLALASLCCMVPLAETGKARWYIMSALFCGLSLGTKLSAAFLAFPFLTAILVDTLRERRYFPVRPLVWSGIALAVVALSFLAVEPYAVLDFNSFLRQNREQTDMARGLWRPPYTIQYMGTPPYLYPLQQMLLHSMGIPLAIAVFLGVIYAVFRHVFFLGGSVVAAATRTPRATIGAFLNVVTFAPIGELLLLIWILALFGVTGGFMVKYPRYLLPLYPQLFILAAVVLRDIGRLLVVWSNSRSGSSSRKGRAGTAAV